VVLVTSYLCSEVYIPDDEKQKGGHYRWVVGVRLCFSSLGASMGQWVDDDDGWNRTGQ
jgi:hypothetical protein